MLFAAERYFRSCRGGVFHRGGIGGSVDQFPEFYFG
jgi:small subunit ribosomal protein S11